VQRFDIVREVWRYTRFRKRYWMGSIILVFVVLSIFVVLVEGSAIAPFIYALF
jgi:ABC-type lipoprotein release transport system permease subunit